MARPAYLWDYDLDETDFQALLAGHKTLGRLDPVAALRRE
jgi:hypothetical protein